MRKYIILYMLFQFINYKSQGQVQKVNCDSIFLYYQEKLSSKVSELIVRVDRPPLVDLSVKKLNKITNQVIKRSYDTFPKSVYKVFIWLIINKNNEIQCLKIVKSEHKDLDILVLKEISKLKFRSAIQAGKPIGMDMYMVFEFNILRE